VDGLEKTYVGRMRPTGATQLFLISSLTGIASTIRGMAAGPDGSVWYTIDAGRIGHITTDGTVTEFPIPAEGSYPKGIARGSDGNIWFVQQNTSLIGRIKPDGTITEFSLPGGRTNEQLWDIAAGPDGNLWVTSYGSDLIYKVTTTGQITGFSITQ